jgi:hypothetical protein
MFPSPRSHSDPGPRWVRTALRTAGPRRARMVDVGESASQVKGPFTVTTLDGEAARRWVRIPPPQPPRTSCSTPGVIGPAVPWRPRNPPSCAWFGQVGRSGTHAGDQGQRLHRGMSLAQTPPGLPLTRRLPGGARLSGAAGGGLLASQGPPCGAPLPPRAGHAWSTFGPHAIGAERVATVSSGTSLRRSHVRSWGNRPPGRTLIRMSSSGSPSSVPRAQRPRRGRGR